MYKVVVVPLAKKDIRDSAAYYNKQSVGLGRKFTREVREKVRFIQCFPKAFSVRNKLVRTTVLKVFPFMIHNQINDSNKTIIILAVLHTSQNPETWARR